MIDNIKKSLPQQKRSGSDHFVSELYFQGTENPCTQAGPREHWAAMELHQPMHKRGIGRKKARVVFHSKPLWGLVFHH